VIVRRTFDKTNRSVPAARRFATTALSEMPTDFVDSVILMISELATNAVQHGRSRFEVVIDCQPDAVQVTVFDQSRSEVSPRTPAVTDIHGRGLQIVRVLADDWGVGAPNDDWQKSVWFTLRVADTESVNR